MACMSCLTWNSVVFHLYLYVNWRSRHCLFNHKIFPLRVLYLLSVLLQALLLFAIRSSHPVNGSKEIDLEENNDSSASRAMIRHIYGLQCDEELDPDAGNHFSLHIKAFTVADKYDVPTLRSSVVHSSIALRKKAWICADFVEGVRAVWSPSTGKPAGRSLQNFAFQFCAHHVVDLMKRKDFQAMVEEEEPFLGKMLTACLSGRAQNGKDIYQCPSCRALSLEGKRHVCDLTGDTVTSHNRDLRPIGTLRSV